MKHLKTYKIFESKSEEELPNISDLKIVSIDTIEGKNKWHHSKEKLIHMVLDLGDWEEFPSNKIPNFYKNIKKYLPSMHDHRCSEKRKGGFFFRVKKGTWLGHITEHVALEIQTLAGYDTGFGRTRGTGKKGEYNVIFNYEEKSIGILAAKEAVKIVKSFINDEDPKIKEIVEKLKKNSNMKYLKEYNIFESSTFFTISDERRKKLITYLSSYLDGNDTDFTSWIYENIIRGKQENTQLSDFIKKVAPSWKKILDEYLSKYKSGVMKILQDDQNEWIQPTYNSSLKQKEVKGDQEITNNFYVTFEKSEDNLKKWFNGLASLISDFYKACTEGELKNSAIAFKFGYDAKHFIEDNDHLKFYWYKDEDKSKVLEIYNNWLKKTGIKTQKRAYEFGIDTTKGRDKNSFGLMVATKVNDQLKKLKSQYGKKFTAEQYADYIVDMLNKTKFKIE